MSRLLIVTADDLGLTVGVNRAVRRAHLEGIVTSTSLLAVGRAFDDAASMLRATPTLDLGAHLAIVGEDPPLLTAREVPTLVDRRGTFPLSYRTVLARALALRLDPDDVRREMSAQLERVRSVGLPVTHLDTHQHTHLVPVVGRILIELATEHEVPAVRLPRSRSRGLTGAGVTFLARHLRHRLARAGLSTTADYAGLDEAGALDLGRLAHAVRGAAARGARSLEVNTHPGEPGDPELERFAWHYRWDAELDLLVSAEARALVGATGHELGGFGRLASAGADTGTGTGGMPRAREQDEAGA